MTPKEKAKEVFNKICLAIATEKTEFGYYTNVVHAREIALIAVDEILEVVSSNLYSWNYWYEVKSEIEKL
jgi:hypothetical protein